MPSKKHIRKTTKAITQVSSQLSSPYRRVVSCPEEEDGERAIVTLSWNREERRPLVVQCDHRRRKDGKCMKGCEVLLQSVFTEPIPTVLP